MILLYYIMLKYAIDLNKYKDRDQNADYHEEYQ